MLSYYVHDIVENEGKDVTVSYAIIWDQPEFTKTIVQWQNEDPKCASIITKLVNKQEVAG